MFSWVLNNPHLQMLTLLTVAILLGGLIGAQRGRAGKPAGSRTHGLVALGSAVLVLACRQNEMNPSDVSRVIQGIAAGVGFIGGGAILKSTTHEEVRGLTTATTIWLTTAVGVTAGLGNVILATVTTLLGLFVLTVFHEGEKPAEGNRQKE